MKKLFTLFILAALFAIPRNAQAVYWEVSDGTHYRVNPKNPSDPNDTIPIPAGTKFMRPMIGYYYAARWIDGGWSYLLTPQVNTSGPDFNGWYSGPSITSTTGIRINQSLVTPLSGSTYLHWINFPDAALRARLVERILGYNWLQISYGNNSYSSVFQNPTTEKIKYAYQIVITEAEADSITELNFDPEEYGLNPVLGGVMSLKGLEMFRNLEKLVLRGNRYLGMSWGTNCYSCEILQYASEHIDFSVFPKLKILDISNIGRAYHGTLSSSELPSSLEYLYMINSSLYDALYLDGSTNLKKIEISGSVGWQTAHREAHAPSWHYDDVHSPCQDGFSNIAITNSTIDSLILRDNPHLYSLTFGDTQDRSKIKYLDVSGSKIKKLSSVGHGIEIDTIIARDVDFTPGGVLSSQEGVGYGQLEWTGKNLKYLDVSGSTIGTVSCPNMLGSFDIVVTGSIIKRLNLRDNNFTHLDVSDGNIEELYCQNNMLETLKVNGSLLRLECQNNNLSALNIPSTPDTPVQEHVSYNTYWTIVPTPDFDPSNFNEEAAYLTGIDYNPDCGDPNYYQFDYFDYETGRWMRYREVNDYCDWEYNGLGGVTRTEIPAPEGYTAKYVTDTIKTYTGGPGTNAITYLDCSNNSPMTSLTLPKASNLETLYCYNNNLTALDLTACTSLKILRMSHNKISQINISNCKRLEEIYARNRNGERGFSGWNHGLTSLDCSGLKNLHTVLVPRNKMTSLNMSGCEALRTLQCEAQGGDTVRLLDTLNLAGCTNLTTLECQNNGLTSLDISTCTKLQPSGVKAYMQRNVKDVVVLDRDKVCIELVNGVTPTIADGEIISDADMTNFFGTWSASGFDKNRNKVVKRGGKTYLVIYDIGDNARGGTQKRADVDFYGKQLKYQNALWTNNWNETVGGSLANGKKTDNVTITTYPYVMYINPITKDIYTEGADVPFHSGTLYLDYNAVVPPGTEAYIATGFQKNKDEMYTGAENTSFMQLNLVKLLPGEGATNVVVPAGTPIYVKSLYDGGGTGLFDFARNLAGENLAVLPEGVSYSDNKLRGTLDTIRNVTPLSVLSLGRGRSINAGLAEGYRVGFWRNTGTIIPAHRAYILASDLPSSSGNVSALTFAFFDDENVLPTSIDRMESVTNTIDKQQQGWYTVSGIRLKGKPTTKGLYIHNGKKVFVE